MIHMADVMKLFAEHRGDAIVIPGRSGRFWVNISETAFDLPLGDPAMGGHAGFGLGVALAQPNRRVVLFESEGDILMSLGMSPANFYHFILDNECYATTGGQPVPNARNVAYDVLARGAGYPRTHAFTELDALSRELPGILRAPGPVLVAMKVLPEVENEPISRRVRWRKRTADKVVQDLRTALATS
jgi:thiamine pyrophosphate-dependent acetolactate synthase large subunit-like protein